MSRNGIDVSSNNHPGNAPIDWPKVKADGIDWAAVKATEATDYVNPFCAADVAGAETEGIEVVLYHFARPTSGTGGDNARALANEAAKLDFKGMMALDLEDGRQLGWEWLAAWVKDFVSVQPVALLYAPGSYVVGLEPFGWPFGAQPWEVLGSGGNSSATPAVMQSGQGTIEGISGAVDLDVVYYAEVLPPAPEPEPTPPPDVVANVYVPSLGSGNQGPTVKALQALLNAHGGTLAVDGVFGALTMDNVQQFQEAKGIGVTGFVDPGTWEHLLTT